MSGDLYAVAGKRFYLGPAIALKSTDYAEADFTALSFTEVDGWETHGAFGDTAQVITTSLINRSRDQKQKGTKNAGSMENNFAYVPGDAGQELLDAAVASNSNFAIKILGNDAPAERSSTVTMTIAAPGVITWASHGLEVGAKVKFTTSGALPTGLTAGTEYFVVEVPSANTFQVSATKGGAAITTTGTQSGTHTATTVPTASVRYFVGLVMTNAEQGGSANTVQMLSVSIELNSNVVKIPAFG